MLTLTTLKHQLGYIRKYMKHAAFYAHIWISAVNKIVFPRVDIHETVVSACAWTSYVYKLVSPSVVILDKPFRTCVRIMLKNSLV